MPVIDITYNQKTDHLRTLNYNINKKNNMMKIERVLVVAAIIILSGGCTNNRQAKQIARDYPVRVTTTGCNGNNGELHYIGTVEAESSVSVSFPIGGTIEQMYASTGQRVTKGKLLACLNGSAVEAGYNAAKALREQAEDAMQRTQMMYDSQSIAEIKYIDVVTQLEKAKSMEKIAKKSLDDNRLYAPIDGIIGQKMAETGENVIPNQSVYTIYQIEQRVCVNIAVPEKEIGIVECGQSAECSIAALNDVTYQGTVSEKGIFCDPLSHSYSVRIRINNTGQRLLPGMVCKVSMQSKSSADRSIVVPERSVQRACDTTLYVWVVVDSTVDKRVVTTGRMTESGVEIVSGLEQGEMVVTDGYQNIYQGATIRVVEQ